MMIVDASKLLWGKYICLATFLNYWNSNNFVLKQNNFEIIFASQQFFHLPHNIYVHHVETIQWKNLCYDHCIYKQVFQWGKSVDITFFLCNAINVRYDQLISLVHQCWQWIGSTDNLKVVWQSSYAISTRHIFYAL